MEVDRETKIKHPFISYDSNVELRRLLEENAKQCYGDENSKDLLISNEIGTFNTEELYVDDGEIHYSGVINSPHGDIYLSFDLPISNKLLIGILEHSQIKFDKLKRALSAID